MKESRFTKKEIIFIVFGAVVLFWALQKIDVIAYALSIVLGLIFPFALGCGIAFLLNLPLRFIEKGVSRLLRKPKAKKAVRPVSIVLVLMLFILLIGGVVAVVIPQIGDTVISIQDELPGFKTELMKFIEHVESSIPKIGEFIERLGIDFAKITATIANTLKDWGGKALVSSLSFATSVFSGAVNFGIGFVFAIYLLLRAYLPRRVEAKVLETLKLIDNTFSGFFRGQCLEAFILGLMFLVGMTILRFPYAILIAVLVSVTALIPIFGAFIACFIGAFLILVANPMQALWFVIFFLVMQQIEGNFIYPKVMGNYVGLPSIWVLAAVSIGGSMFGI
ncbi:MAG: AI-2E family transporter, partial [Angelakisella sp.]